ncbi:MAG: pseudouridine synthase [Monoraphidium minutum]|nr:MAG: pseudouridine synthase [Monoraphidium minutum]
MRGPCTMLLRRSAAAVGPGAAPRTRRRVCSTCAICGCSAARRPTLCGQFFGGPRPQPPNSWAARTGFAAVAPRTCATAAPAPPPHAWAAARAAASGADRRPPRGAAARAAADKGSGGTGAGADGDDGKDAGAPADPSKPLRIERLLANLGYGKRQECATLVKRGRVTLAASGSALRVGDKARAPEVLLDGEPLDPHAPLVVALHKPAGYVVTSPDDARVVDPVVYDLLPHRFGRRRPFLSAVGRLDKETSGLLLLTDDGQLLHRIKSPSKRIWKVYVATLDAPLGEKEAAAAARRFASGTLLLTGDRAPLLPAALKVLGDGRTAEVALAEGRYHQVRRMFAALGREVVALHRRSIGALALDGLPEGEWRYAAQADLDLVFGGPDMTPAGAGVGGGGGERRPAWREGGAAAAGGEGGGGGRGGGEGGGGGRGGGEGGGEGVEDPEALAEEEVGERRYRDGQRWKRRRAAMRREVGAVLGGDE